MKSTKYNRLQFPDLPVFDDLLATRVGKYQQSLFEAFRKSGLSYKQLSEMCNCSVSSLRSWFNCKCVMSLASFVNVRHVLYKYLLSL